MTMTESPETSKALAAVEGGTMAFGDFLRTVAKREVEGDTHSIDLPKKVVLSADQKAALSIVESLLDAAVTPTERRALDSDEVVALMTERGTLDAIAKLIEDRKEAQRAAMFNHFDVVAESEGIKADRDSKGHYLAKAELVVEGTGKKFTREVRTASPTLTAEALLEQVGESFTHDDYLACTSQVRVVDEAKLMLHLRKRPEIISAIAAATSEGKSTSALYVRKG